MIDRKKHNPKTQPRASSSLKYRKADLKVLADYLKWSKARGYAHPEFRGHQFDRYDLENHASVMAKDTTRKALPKTAPSKAHKGDISRLGAAECVNFRLAEEYLGISARQRQILQAKQILEVRGGGRNRMIAVESLTKYLPPENAPNNAK